MAAKPKLKRKACVFVFFPLDQVDVLLTALRKVIPESEEDRWQVLVWNKQQTPAVGGHAAFSRQCEAILYCNIGNRPLNVIGQATLYGNVFQFPFTEEDKTFKAWKPVALLKRLIELTTSEGHAVLDCFAGVGSTGIACNQLRRNFVVMEKNASQYAIARVNLPDAADQLP